MDTFDNLYSKFVYSPLSGNGVNRTADCPFCEGANKFSFDINTGQAKCLSPKCNTNVNYISFLTKFHKTWLDYTTDEHYEELSAERGPSVSVLRSCRLAYDSYKNRWLVPYKNPYSEYLCGLGYFYPFGDNAYRIFKTANIQGKIPLTFYNPYQPIAQNTKATARIVEGEWDLWSLMTLAISGSQDLPQFEDTLFPQKKRKSTSDSNYIYLAVPGALNFIEANKKWFDNVDKVELYYDNDEAGHLGIQKAAFVLSSWGKTFTSIQWDRVESAEENYDIRDMLIQYPDERSESYFQITNSLGDVATDNPELEEELSDGYVASLSGISEIPEFDMYVDEYANHIHLNEHNKMSMAIVMAIASSQYMPGEALWFFLKGQAGCGKTTLIESYGGRNEYFDYASRITAKNLVSGWNSGDEPSLITRMNGKCFFVKDFTVVLGMPNEARKEVFNLFRDIYDGTLHITFGNGKVCNFHNLRFNMVAGVTDQIMKHNDSSMGERFLRCDYMGPTTDDKAIIDAALGGFGQSTKRKTELTQSTLGYVKTLAANQWKIDTLPTMSKSTISGIGALARYTAYIRTRTESDRSDGLSYRPRAEVASRLALQYAKLGYGLEKVFNPKIKAGKIIDFSDITMEHIAKIANDTSEGFSNEIVRTLYENPRMSRKRLTNKLGLPSTRMHRVITEMKQTGLLRTVLNTGEIDAKGRPTEYYSVNKEFEPIVSLVSKHFNMDA
jgi:hypothetical protein